MIEKIDETAEIVAEHEAKTGKWACVKSYPSVEQARIRNAAFVAYEAEPG